MSSAKAEFFALTQSAAETLGLMTMMDDFAVSAMATSHTDASVAVGIVRRAGPDKLRHLNVRWLWLHDYL